MAKQRFIDKSFKPASLALIRQANEIIDEYIEQGYSLTLRQLYYQFVARDFIENSQRAYKRLGDLINNARLAGLIDWDAIEDRTRNLARLAHWNDPGEIIESAASQYRVDKWRGQPYRVEVWIEKEALAGVIGKNMQSIGRCIFCLPAVTFRKAKCIAPRSAWLVFAMPAKRRSVIHLGDHDPSGLDMTRDIIDRLRMFVGSIDVERIALNMDQIDLYNPPPNPAKVNDSRFIEYQQRYGRQSWELDALSPEILEGLITRTVEKYRDGKAYDNAVDLENTHKAILARVSNNWETL
jgi:hypothetical protein